MEIGVKLRGRVRIDRWGQIVVDTCPSDEEHLRSSKTDPEAGKPTCRRVLETELFEKRIGQQALDALGECEVEVIVKLTPVPRGEG